MEDKKRKLIDAFLTFFDFTPSEEVMARIDTDLEDVLDSDFFEDIDLRFKWRLEDALDAISQKIEFEEEHKNDIVTLNQKKKIMYFNSHGVPAYWYSKDMTDDEIAYELSQYRRLWFDSGFVKFKYPLLETWASLDLWETYYKNPADLQRMEKELERGDTDQARKLQSLRDCGFNIGRLYKVYPDKIKSIHNIHNRSTVNNEDAADITLELYNGENCDVRVRANKWGIIGMTALGPRGFPCMTDSDNQMIIKEVFGK